MESHKFSCPECALHIQAEPSSAGCKIQCPECSVELIVPAYNPSAMALPEARRSRHAQGSATVDSATQPPGDAASPAPQESPVDLSPKDSSPLKKIPDHEAKMAHVGSLTPAIKLEVVRWARRRIAHPNAWLPHEKKGHGFVYAAVPGDHGNESVSYDHEAALMFSLLGAILVELKVQHASLAAEGREEFLDHEIQDAARTVLQQHDWDCGPEADPLALLDHAQSLEVLKVLESDYQQASEHMDDMLESARLPGVDMAELVRRAEQGTLVTSNEVLSVLYHELHLLNRRVEDLERRIASQVD